MLYAPQCSNNTKVYSILFVYVACTVGMELHSSMKKYGNLVLRTASYLYSVFEYKLLICIPHIVKSGVLSWLNKSESHISGLSLNPIGLI